MQLARVYPWLWCQGLAPGMTVFGTSGASCIASWTAPLNYGWVFVLWWAELKFSKAQRCSLMGGSRALHWAGLSISVINEAGQAFPWWTQWVTGLGRVWILCAAGKDTPLECSAGTLCLAGWNGWMVSVWKQCKVIKSKQYLLNTTKMNKTCGSRIFYPIKISFKSGCNQMNILIHTKEWQTPKTGYTMGKYMSFFAII